MSIWVGSADVNMVKWGSGLRFGAHMIQVGVYSRLKGQIISQIQNVHWEKLWETLWANPGRSITIIWCQRRDFKLHAG